MSYPSAVFNDDHFNRPLTKSDRSAPADDVSMAIGTSHSFLCSFWHGATSDWITKHHSMRRHGTARVIAIECRT
jgi:hypothetical protein